jgi:L-threonylcarbamoyladenylate synthase
MSAIDEAVEVLRRGGVVACPTETLVGLLADATNPEAVEAVLRIKGRGGEKTLALLVPDLDVARALVELSSQAEELARRHWPGALTLVARARVEVHQALAQEGKVGLRVPGPSLSHELVKRFGGPLTATSANLTGGPAVANTLELDPGVRQAADLVLEGASPGGPPSTVVDVSEKAPRVLRHGAILLDL